MEKISNCQDCHPFYNYRGTQEFSIYTKKPNSPNTYLSLPVKRGLKVRINVKRPSNWRKIRLMVIERDNHRCVRCGTEEKNMVKRNGFIWYESNFDIDHIVPIKLGGSADEINNLQTLCKYCHDKKNRWDQSLIAKYKREKLKIFKSEEKE